MAPKPGSPKHAGGRRRNDDSAAVAGILFEWNVLGYDYNAVLNAAADHLVRAEQDAANAAAGKPRRVIKRGSARRRLDNAVKAELRRSGLTPLTGLPSSMKTVGEILATVAKRDGRQAARALFVKAITLSLSDHILTLPECAALAEGLVTQFEEDVGRAE